MENISILGWICIVCIILLVIYTISIIVTASDNSDSVKDKNNIDKAVEKLDQKKELESTKEEILNASLRLSLIISIILFIIGCFFPDNNYHYDDVFRIVAIIGFALYGLIIDKIIKFRFIATSIICLLIVYGSTFFFSAKLSYETPIAFEKRKEKEAQRMAKNLADLDWCLRASQDCEEMHYTVDQIACRRALKNSGKCDMIF